MGLEFSSMTSLAYRYIASTLVNFHKKSLKPILNLACDNMSHMTH